MAKKEIEQTEIEAPYELPEGWKWCRLGDVAEIARGGSPRPIEKYLTTAEDGINWIKIGDTEKNGKYIFTTKEKIIKEGLSKTRYVEEGDFLLTNSMSFGRPYILKTSGCIHDGWLVIKQCTAYNQDFLYYLLSSSAVFSQFVSLAKGSTVKNLKSETVRQVILPLPPTLAEQQRIVNRIESMFAKLDEAKEKAQNVVDGFETRKAAILHKAFTGELTAKWRKENGVSDDSWVEKTIGEICLVKGGKRVPKGMSLIKEKNEHPYLKAGNLKFGTVIDKDMEYVPNDVFILIKNYTVNAGDVYITNVGACIGDCGIIPDYYHGANLTENAVKLTEMICNNSYLAKQLSSNLVQTQIKSKIKSATLGKLSIDNIKQLKINLPTLPEQQEIVRILDSVLEKENKAKQAAEAVLEQIDLLKKTILARAFRGEL